MQLRYRFLSLYFKIFTACFIHFNQQCICLVKTCQSSPPTQKVKSTHSTRLLSSAASSLVFSCSVSLFLFVHPSVFSLLCHQSINKLIIFISNLRGPLCCYSDAMSIFKGTCTFQLVKWYNSSEYLMTYDIWCKLDTPTFPVFPWRAWQSLTL